MTKQQDDYILHNRYLGTLEVCSQIRFGYLQYCIPTVQYYSTVLYQTQGAERSQPAMKTRRNEDVNKMCKIKDVNVRMNMMYDMCACYYHVL
jgi:hypothetical protein